MPVWVVAAGCAPPAPPPPSCDAAWAATVQSLSDLVAEAAGGGAAFPPREAYVERCGALALSPAQLRCLEPPAARADPAGCAAALEPVRDPVEALAAWFVAETTLPDPAARRSPADRSQP